MSMLSGIPIKHYFDEAAHKKEMETLFSNRPIYIGATGMLKNDGDYRAVERMGESKILSKKDGEFALLDNVCAHRQAKMVSGAGNSRYITCPFHRWSFEHGTGNSVRLPLCKVGPEEKARLSLGRTPVEVWKNLVFTGNRKMGDILNNIPIVEAMQIDKMVYHKSVSEKLDYNWKHYIDVFGENYHIPFVHPGFAAFLDIPKMTWEEHPDFHVQVLRPQNLEYLRNHKTTPVYRRWVDGLVDFYKGELPEYAGILVMFYPNIMMEVYPLYMVITTVHPTGVESAVLHSDYFHHEDIIEARPDLVEAAEAACAETMLEDAGLCDETARGRRFLYEQGRDLQGPYVTPFEDGLMMFHRYYHRMMSK